MQDDRDSAGTGDGLRREITAAHAALAELAGRAKEDPSRPLFHFLPPGGWMNDPNGTIHHTGFYHLFYQHNPFDDRWGRIHWGHARSRDLVNWEHLPIALWPSEELGEGGCFSGCCTISPAGIPTILYTKTGAEAGPWEQWAATSDDEMVRWEKDPCNPVLSLTSHGGPPLAGDWRDPYLFRAAGRSFLVLGARLIGEAGGDYAVILYESPSGNPLEWRYRGTLLRRPSWEGPFFECPNFFPSGDRWLLLVSPYGPVEYYTGEFDPEGCRFTPSARGILDAGIDFYATNTASAPDGRRLLFGWVRGFPRGRGWNGCLAIPRELTLGPDGRPLQQPIREMERLRGRALHVTGRSIDEEELIVADAGLECAEIEFRFRLEGSSGIELRVLRGRGGRGAASLRYDGQFLDAFGTKIEYGLADPATEVHLRLFVDRSVTELFVDGGRRAVTRVVEARDGGGGLSIRTLGGSARLEALTAWPMAKAEIRPVDPAWGL